MPNALDTLLQRLRHRPEVSTTRLALVASVLFSLTCNNRFWGAVHAPDLSAAANAFLLAGTFVAVTALQFIVLSLLLNRWTAKPLLTLIILLTAATVYFMQKYGVYMDTSMVRNVVETDAKESRELLAWDMLPHLLFYAVLPLAVLWRLRIRRPPLRNSWYVRPLAILLAIIVAAAALGAVSKHLVPLIREQKEVRYLITPSNWIYSLTRVLTHKQKEELREKAVIGADARLATPAAGRKPRLVLVVIGETVRAANWGLNGYARQTTPELAQRDVINFRDVTSCGTNTETSVPCMFSMYGRRHYDEDDIRGSEGFLHVLDRAGVRVLWRDNQSGCKGVCDRLESHYVRETARPEHCRDGRCLDEALLDGLDQEVAKTPGDLVVVLHMLGNHGPAYFQRYPPEFRRYTPTCDTTELGKCSVAAIVNTYDNAVLYTDHVLAMAVDFLKAQAAARDTAMIYLSDHGESLGENGLYLHSLPYAIAPDFQTHVPLVMWLSPGYAQGRTVDATCLAQRAQQPASHDNLFHTVLGLFDVQTSIYERDMDLTGNCRSQ